MKNGKKIRVGIVGVGNCASALVQGISYYSKTKSKVGLMHWEIGGYKPEDIEIVAAFDIDKRKVGKPVSEAIFSPPNCTKVFFRDIENSNVIVEMGPILDGFSPHMMEYDPRKSIIPADVKPVDVVKVLKERGVEVLVNYVPVGAENAAKFYAECALEAKSAFINCMPCFIASDEKWAKKFEEKCVPIIGDDIKSQVGATITHRALVNLFKMRGVKILRTYQLNFGGNSDFLNMLERSRLKTKKISKTYAVKSLINDEFPEENIHIGPSDYVPFLNDNKIAYIRIEGIGFGGVPLSIELKLDVEDSPNSAAVVIDAIRCAKLALERGIGGPIYSVSAFSMKHPPKQIKDEEALKLMEDFISGKSNF